MMQEALEQLVAECHPNCLVSDMLFPWTTDTAAKFNIPRIGFSLHGMLLPCKKASGVISLLRMSPLIPKLLLYRICLYEIKLTRTQLSPSIKWRKRQTIEDKAERGKKSSIDKNECLKWLDSKKPSSIVYVCFEA
ncbi:hypothetical protein HAX54_033750 [Datura stramonium]|uniref:Uncharacterized protein n=1 Tax=Datura stramonium TaxID=4076 RepID=A0ABS8VGK4_DATST|nr:hypothetical protein [Datura stramonium]